MYLKREDDSNLILDIGIGQKFRLTPHEANVIKDFFQHERDEELGRWRWPENPDYVVYPVAGECALVIDEQRGRREPFNRGESGMRDSEAGRAAKAYFAAHTEPKPWQAAQPGEVWLLTYGGQETAHVWTDRWAGDGYAFVSDRAIVVEGDPDITAGRRIYPQT